MCRLEMSLCVLQYQAICNHIANWLAVTQDNENYNFWLYHRLRGKKYRVIDWNQDDFPLITNQVTGLFIPTINTSLNHGMYYVWEIIYQIPQFITCTCVYNSLNKHIGHAKDNHWYVESPASHPSVTRLFWPSHPPPAEKCECSTRLSWRTVTVHFCTTR